ncbi:ribbon-helix-helix domain-containing protein [Xanthobacter sp. TB0139]|uniref:ribbon-helix-helix domain-containing protein n=1 Tax=Xanthobacter sp. TB0139 TaxID=3459178 RepID=UPI004039EA3A
MANALQAVLDRAAQQKAQEVEKTPAPQTRRGGAGGEGTSTPAEVTPEVSASVEVEKPKRTSRTGTRLIGGHFPPEVARQLRMLAAEEDTTVQALLEEAIGLLFVKKGRAALLTRKS